MDNQPVHDLTYQAIWGDSERQDLIPPQEINLSETGNKNRFPMTVNINLPAIKQLLKEEGVTRGNAVSIELFYGGQAQSGPPIIEQASHSHTKPLRSLYQRIRNNCVFGWQRSHGHHEQRLTLNLPLIYTFARIFGLGDNQQTTNHFTRFVGAYLAHEVGHARQPTNIKRAPLVTRLLLATGGFILTDTLRRTFVPFAQLAEPPLVLSELAFGAAISDA